MSESKTRVLWFKIHDGPGKAVKIIGAVIAGLIALTVLALLFGIFVKLLWNALMPAVFGLPEIGFWQAVGLVVLAHILFGGDHSHHYEHSRRKKRPADDGSFRKEMERDYLEFWRQEGREAFRQWMGRENGILKEEE